MNFAEFIEVLAELPDDITDRHLHSQSWFLCDAQGLLPDFIGKLENFDADWKYISDKYALLQPPHRNKTDSSVELSDICPPESIN
jgi:hypothetical protein